MIISREEKSHEDISLNLDFKPMLWIGAGHHQQRRNTMEDPVLSAFILSIVNVYTMNGSQNEKVMICDSGICHCHKFNVPHTYRLDFIHVMINVIDKDCIIYSLVVCTVTTRWCGAGGTINISNFISIMIWMICCSVCIECEWVKNKKKGRVTDGYITIKRSCRDGI